MRTYTGLWRSIYEVKFENNPPVELNLFKSRDEISSELITWMERNRPDIDSAERQVDGDKIVALLLAKKRITVEEAKRAWGVTIVPPLALLAFDICIFWIARGFRPRVGNPLNTHLL